MEVVSCGASSEVHWSATYLVLGNSSTRKTPAVVGWRHPRSVRHFTLTSSSWLSLVERWFSELTTKKPRRGTQSSARQLNAAHPLFDPNLERQSRSYSWTKTADQILASIANYCNRINQAIRQSGDQTNNFRCNTECCGLTMVPAKSSLLGVVERLS
jgi:hypothetical protein